MNKHWHKLFELSIFLKGVNGVWEVSSGVLVLFLSKITLETWFSIVTRYELLEDPNDVLINFLMSAFQNVSNNAQIFAAFYLLLHGLLNIFLTIQLYRNKPWAYLVTIGSVLLLMIYQIYRISIHHSLLLTAITIFDVFFIGLAWHEYKYHQEQRIWLLQN
jgi:uncharacterized membrane protein